MTTQSEENGQRKHKRSTHYTEEEKAKWEAERDVRLSKRLAYLLRYGAEKEGLQVMEGGEYTYCSKVSNFVVNILDSNKTFLYRRC